MPVMLRIVKVLHTIAWAVFVTCIIAIPVASLRDEHRLALYLAGVVAAEVGVLILMGWRCPLTYVAARYTKERHPSFDIYLPEWLARYNKEIFGTLYVAALLFALALWMRAG
jgi:hypothetical protein